MDWPQSLIDELAARRCIIFLGSGVSAGCFSSDNQTSPPTWQQLLNNLKMILPKTYNTETIDNLISKEQYLDAAEILINNIPSADFTKLIRRLFTQPKYEPSRVHEAILEIDPKIVITTNYDDIYDNYCRSGIAVDGYNVCKYYEQHLVADIRSPVRLVVKAHGCVSDPSKIVLARSQYFNAKQKFGAFFSVLDSLFLTNTILFIGYSLSDPDIQLTLENANIAYPSRHPHYALIPNNINSEIEAAASKAYNVKFLKFEVGNYVEVEEFLKELAELVNQQRANNPQ
jgi:hypothetical protein